MEPSSSSSPTEPAATNLVSDADGSNAIQLTSFGIRLTGSPRWSPDGKRIAFDSRVGGEANIYMVEPHGGAPKKLNIDVRGNSVPTWSHDGTWIYFLNAEDAQHPSLWRVPSEGGACGADRAISREVSDCVARRKICLLPSRLAIMAHQHRRHW